MAGGTSSVVSGASLFPMSSSAVESVLSKSGIVFDEEKNEVKTEGDRVCPDDRRGWEETGGDDDGMSEVGDSSEKSPEDSEADRE